MIQVENETKLSKRKSANALVTKSVCKSKLWIILPREAAGAASKSIMIRKPRTVFIVYRAFKRWKNYYSSLTESNMTPPYNLTASQVEIWNTMALFITTHL